MAEGFSPGDIVERIYYNNGGNLRLGEYDTVVPTPEGGKEHFVYTEKYPFEYAGNNPRYLRLVKHVNKLVATKYMPIPFIVDTTSTRKVALVRNDDTTVTLTVLTDGEATAILTFTQSQVQDIISNLQKLSIGE